MPEFNPRDLDSNGPLLSPFDVTLVPGFTEVIVMVGFPACKYKQFAIFPDIVNTVNNFEIYMNNIESCMYT